MKRSIDELMEKELRKSNYKFLRVARMFGVPPAELIAKFGTPNPSHEKANAPRIRPELKQYVVAVKMAGMSWPAEFKASIAAARDKYDAGTHEMCQSSEAGWSVLYLIPRKEPAGKRDYFRTMFDETP